jgi:hypothetical protein
MTQNITPFKIEPLNPSFDAIYAEATTLLLDTQNQTGVWNDIITASSGAFIMRFMSSVAADNIFAVERAQHEVFLETARRDSSIYAITRMLGARIQRITPGSVTCRLFRYTPDLSVFIIPEYSAFEVGGLRFFNRISLTFGNGIDYLDCSLHLGEFMTESFVSNGQAFQKIIVGPENEVSDVDIQVYVDNTLWTRVINGDSLWQHTTISKVYNETTTIEGRSQIDFGDGNYGAIPPLGSIIQVKYIRVTRELNTFASINANTTILCVDYSDIKGFTQEVSKSSVEPRSPSFYKKMAPHIRSANRVSTTRNQYKAKLLQYPNILDVVIRGQAEINPADLRWMNVIEITPLYASPVSNSDEHAIRQYLAKNSVATMHFVFNKSKPHDLDLAINITITPRAKKSEVEAKAESILREYFKPAFGKLGLGVIETDIAFMLKRDIRDPYGALIQDIY